MSGSETDELLSRQRLEPDVFGFREGMLRMADEHERVLAQGDRLQLAVAHGIRDEPEVHDVAEHVLVNLVRAAVFHVDVARWDNSS